MTRDDDYQLENLSLACQWGRCADCVDDTDCCCGHHDQDTEAPAGAAAEDSRPQPVTTQGSLDRGGPYIECAVCHRHYERGEPARAHARSHWAHAVAEWHAQQRRDRWKRPDPPVTGVVKQPD